MGTMVLNRPNYVANANCQAIEQTSNYNCPFLRRVKLAPFAKGKCFVQANAQNEV